MKIKDRLSFQFTLIFAVMLLCVMAAIYYLTEGNRERIFYERLQERAITVAQIFLAQDNLDSAKFKEVQRRYLHTLPEEELKIYNAGGRSVFINQAGADWSAKSIREVVAKKEIHFYDKGRQVAGVYYEDNSGNFVVFASATDIYEYRHMRQMLLVMVFLFVVSIIIVFFLGQWFSRLALSPINKIINEVKIIRSTSLDKRLDTGNGKDEIAELSVTVNSLLEHLEQSFNAQKSFIANASHELRTPLTSVIGMVEVTLRSERTAAEYKKLLENLLAEAGRINELIDSLFEMANANIDTGDLADVRLDELMWQLKDEWEAKLPGSKVELEFSLPGNIAEFTIQGHWLLLFIAIGNILKNAIKFSRYQPVICKVYCESNAAVISITDMGIGISQEDLANIFQPFYRGSNTLEFEGMGIGLSLSEKILKLHNASIHVQSLMHSGTTFIMRFRPNGA